MFSTQMRGITGDSRIRVVSEAAYRMPLRLPPRLGSSARRRGREAERQRAAITNATPSEATIKTARWTFVSALAISASGRTRRRLSSCSRNSITANWRTKRPTKNIPTSTRSTVETSRPPVTKLRISAA
jgi:hypothetical protein